LEKASNQINKGARKIELKKRKGLGTQLKKRQSTQTAG
jgi:hypothetical protein